MKKSLLLTMALMLFVLFNLSAQIKKVDDNTNLSEATITLGGVTVEGNVRAEIFDDADMQIHRYIGGVWQNQYYGTASKSTRLYTDGTAYTGNGGYYTNNSTSMTNVSNTLLDANTAENILETSGEARIVQTTFLPPDATFLTYKYEITNLSGTTWSDARFFHGGDTYLWHSDNGAGFWDAEENIIGVNKISGGIVQQTIYVKGLQPAYAYESAFWADVRGHVRGNALTYDVNTAEYVDNALAMEWRTSGIAPGETWTLEVIEKFGTKDISNLEITGPIFAGIEANDYTDLSFTLTNGNGSAVDAALSVSVDAASWSASILSPSSPINVAAGASQEIIVRLTCPAGASLNDIANATLQATSGSENATYTTTALVTFLPAFTTQPSDVTLCNENEASSFAITGTNISIYEWQEYTSSWSTITDGGVYSGATTGTLNISNSSGLVGNQYRCVITSLNGSNYSDEVSIIQSTGPTISAQPIGFETCDGDPSTDLSVVASGQGTILYQWQLNGSDISGATNNTYTVASLPANSGDYTCVITADCGSVTSDVANISVGILTVITSQPTGGTICWSDPPVNLSVTAQGANLSYQWQLDGTNINGATSNTYTVPSDPANSGIYICIVAGDCGLALSSSATVVINGPPEVTSQPIASEVCQGEPFVELAIEATGAGTLTYQWTYEGTPIPGATNSSYTVVTNPINTGDYYCAVTGDCGSTLSDVVTITVNPLTEIATQPESVTICEEDPNTILSVEATGTGTITYQWQLNGADIVGATSNLYTVVSDPLNAGSYACIVAGDCNTITSDAAVVTINMLTEINTQPIGAEACFGDPDITLFVEATGWNLSYQWQLDGTNISGATSDAHIVTTDFVNAGTYNCVVTGACGSVVSDDAIVTINALTEIISQPAGATLCFGDPDAVLSVGANGTNLTYQWQLNGSNISGANASSYSVATVYSNAGNYTCLVTGECGSITTTEATIIVNIPTTIDNQPIGATVCRGDPDVTFALTASGTDLTYQWKFNGTDISGATTNNYTVATELVNEGSYTCIVTGDCGSVTSDPAILTVNTITIINTQPVGTTLCFGDPDAVLAVGAIGTNLTYQWQLNGADIAGATNSTYNVVADETNAGTYECIVTGACGTETSSNAVIVVNPTFNETDEAEICDTESFIFGTQTLTETGVYTEVFSTTLGCDSTVVLTLTVNPTYNETDAQEICDGDEYIFGTQTLTEAGDYTEIFSSTSGCDSTVVLTLMVNPVFNETDEVSVCEGEEYIFGTQTLTEAGIYSELFNSISGCDSTVILTFIVNPEYNETDAVSICNGSVYEFGSQSLTESGVYTELFTSISGCDSIVVLTLAVLDEYFIDVEASICEGGSYVLGTQTLTETGVYSEVFVSTLGCDSTVTLTLDVMAAFNVIDEASICEGDEYVFGTQTLTESGVYVEVFTPQIGCDSTVTLTLTVNPVYNETEIAEICDGDIFVFGTQVLTTSGVYTEMFSSLSACDSTVVLTLTVNPVYDLPQTAEICDGEEYIFGTQTLTETGVYSELFTSVAGCDSLVNLTFTVNPVYYEVDAATICEGDEYIFGTQTLTEAGVYTEMFTSSSGCDSTVVLTVTVNPIYNETEAATICEGDEYIFGTQTLTAAGDYTEVFSTILGCDSTIVLTLTVNPVFNETYEAEICEGDTYVFGTQTLTETGIYTEVFNTILGCDSTVALTLIVNPVYNVDAEAAICEGGYYDFGTQTLTETGVYTELFTSISGCDSTVTLSLTVIDNFNVEDEATICEGDEYIFGTQVLTEPGVYTELFNPQVGCDSTVVLTLYVNPTYTETDEATICEGDEYIFGTQILTEAGVFTEVFATVLGCDSTVVLTLTVNPVYEETDDAVICEGDEYIFGTQTLIETGVYTEVFATVLGCDSTVVLTLIVNPVFDETDEAIICEGDEFIFGTQVLTVSGVYTEVFTSISGCDSTVVLSLTVDPIAIASFTYEQELSIVTFTNTSLYGESYLWDFDDGNTSTEENPVHDFINNGIYTVNLAVTNPCGTKYYQEDVQITGVGIQQVKFTNINVYPNPASSFVTIKGIDSYEVDIYDIIGNLMLSTSDKEIDVSNIPRGTYFVIVKDTNGVLLKTEKLIIH